MKLKRNSLLGKITDNINNFLSEHQEFDTVVGKIRNFFVSQNKLDVDYNKNVSIHNINVYSSLDYNRILTLIDDGYNLLINYSYIEDQNEDKFILNLRKGLMIRGMYMTEVSSGVIICAQPYIEVTNTSKTKKGGAKIYRFPTNYK